MLGFIIRRLMDMVLVLIGISIVSFAIIQLPPGDYLTTLMATMEEVGEVDYALIEALRVRYGLDQPMHVQYWRWFTGLLRGDFGWSFEWNRPVGQLIWDRLALTMAISLTTLLFSWMVSFSIGFYSAVRQYSYGDYVAQVLGYVGLATPNFLLALILMWISFEYLGWSVGGLFSPEFREAAWSWARFVDLLKHLWIPVIVIGTAGTAGLIRITRANLLDQLRQPYVEAARSRGLSEFGILIKYPARIALNPFFSTVGWMLPGLVSGEAIIGVVLNLPTTGPLLLRALQSQDMYLAGSFIMMLSVLTVIGTLVSDIILAWMDPRIRYD